MEVKNYNQPVDASLFPEGCPRCSLLKFLLHLVPVAAVGLWGAYAAFRVLAHGLGETGLDDYFGFGLWITFDLAVIALGAGAFFTGALRYLLNIDALKNIINLTVVVGFLCYSGAMLVLVLDIGQPLRAWFGYWHPNVHSMLTEVIYQGGAEAQSGIENPALRPHRGTLGGFADDPQGVEQGVGTADRNSKGVENDRLRSQKGQHENIRALPHGLRPLFREQAELLPAD